MAQNGMELPEPNPKGWGQHHDLAEMADFSPWNDLLEEDQLAPTQFAGVHGKLGSRTREALVFIGQGAHQRQQLMRSLDLKAHSTDFHVGSLQAKGLIAIYRNPDAPEAIEGRLYYLTPLGKDYFQWYTGKSCAKSEFERLMDQTQNRAYLRHEGAYIDAVKYSCSRRRTKAWVKPCRYVPGSNRKARIQPDMCIELHSNFDRRLDVQIELGRKAWREQIRQVAFGAVKSLCTVGRCDLFVRDQRVAMRLSNTLRNRIMTLIPQGASIQAPGELRIFPVEKVFDLAAWPYSDDGAMMTLQLAADGTMVECRKGMAWKAEKRKPVADQRCGV